VIPSLPEYFITLACEINADLELGAMTISSREDQGANSESEPKLRHEFVGMMFAVAIGEVGLQTGNLVQAHHWVHFLPAYSHLFLATVVIATSWIGWTLSPSPGARADVKSVFEWEFSVLLLDVLLVVVYFILARSVDVVGEKELRLNASSAPESFWIFVMFCFYLVWDFFSKVVVYLSKKRREAWLYNYGIRIAPTISCCFLAYLTKRLVQGADPPHVLTADLSLIALVLLFRSLKDLTSALCPKPDAHKHIVRARKKWAIAWSLFFGLVMVVGILWTRLWPIPRSIAVEIRDTSLTSGSGPEKSTLARPGEQANDQNQ
jgi:hypothetical protein